MLSEIFAVDSQRLVIPIIIYVLQKYAMFYEFIDYY